MRRNYGVERFFSMYNQIKRINFQWNQSLNKTACIRAKPLVFRLSFKVLWSSNNTKKLNVKKIN